MKPRLTKDEFRAWRAHPVTEIVDQYHRDLVQMIRGFWAAGDKSSWNDEAHKEVEILEGELLLSLDTINDFYEVKEADERITSDPNVDE